MPFKIVHQSLALLSSYKKGNLVVNPHISPIVEINTNMAQGFSMVLVRDLSTSMD
jgi:hypothetical protein